VQRFRDPKKRTAEVTKRRKQSAVMCCDAALMTTVCRTFYGATTPTSVKKHPSLQWELTDCMSIQWNRTHTHTQSAAINTRLWVTSRSADDGKAALLEPDGAPPNERPHVTVAAYDLQLQMSQQTKPQN